MKGQKRGYEKEKENQRQTRVAKYWKKNKKQQQKNTQRGISESILEKY